MTTPLTPVPRAVPNGTPRPPDAALPNASVPAGRPPLPFAEALAAQYTEADLARTIPDPSQPRKTFDPEGLRELAANIDRTGLQNPVHLRPAEGDLLMLISGARRVEAFRLLGRTHIPAFVHAGPLAPRQLRLMQVSENLLREGVNPIEQAIAFRECMGDGTASDLARELGVSVSTISRPLKLLSALPPDIQESVRQGLIPGRVAQELCRAKGDDCKRKLADLYRTKQLRTAEELRQAIKNGTGTPPPAPAGFTCEESGCRIAVTLPPAGDLAAVAAALKTVLEDLRKHAHRGLGHWKTFLAKKARFARKATELKAAQDDLAGLANMAPGANKQPGEAGN